MAGRIRQEDLEAVRERTDIVKLVSGYLTLKKAGHDSFVGLCPFHAEKTPSFSVSPSKGLYYCFGCGAGGDSIRFLRDVEHLEFSEAVERLAAEAGIRLRYEGDSAAERRAASRRQALHRANEEAAALYHRTLLEGREGEQARAYLQARGIDREAAVAFEVGYAPGYPDFLLRRLARSLAPEILLEAGLVLRDQDGGLRDRFRGRITFPVHDLSGRAVGIGARVLPGGREEGPKYLNSPETPVYRKAEVLYNLHRAKAAVSRSGEIVVVEGYTDVIALVRAGVEHAVATCGTALGEGHFRLASRFAQRMVLAFDSDEAGARAAERAYAFLEQFPVQPVVLILPEGLDPADFVQRHGAEAFRELASSARPLVEYMLRRGVGRHDLSTVEGQTAAVSAALPILEGLSDPVRQREYAHLLSELAGVSESSVLLALERRLAGRPAEVARAIKRGSVQERVEREMLRLLVRDPDIWAALADRLSEDHFQSAANRKLFELLRAAGGDGRRVATASEDEKVVRGISALALEPVEGEVTAEYAHDVWARLQEFALKRRSDAIRGRLQKLNPTTEADEYDRLFQDLIATDGELRRLKERRGAPV
ncbi:MAG TPA: DNA primase [Actinomycetota bacterium]|nr:DNA primase [Actinomycetota bacterium]